MNRLALAICVLALAFVVVGASVSVAPVAIKASPLTAVDPQEPALTGDGFAPNAVFTIVAPPPAIDNKVELYGSAVNGDASTGTVRSRWYRPVSFFYLLLCGYPVGHGQDIFLEVDTGQGLRQLSLNLSDNPASWRVQKVSLPQFSKASRFRVVATDASPQPMGWIGFSQPFTIRGQSTGELLKQLLLVSLCTAAALVVILGPGFVLRARFARFSSAVWLPIPGVLFLTALGLFAWKGPKQLSPELISRTGVALLILAVGYQFLRRPLTSLTSHAERRILGLILVLIALAVAKAVYSIGPAGELYQGQISRILETGGRGDSRIPFHVIQLVGLRKGGYSHLAEILFGPWNFSHRGPVAGLAASPIVFTTRAQVPDSPPDNTWTVFDPQGFAAYRIAMIVMAATSLLVVYGLAAAFLDEKWAVLAFLAAAGAPFTVHEIFFTWPKLLAAAFVLLGGYLIRDRRFLPAGLAVGFGYLCHPSALLWFPAILLLIPLFDSPNRPIHWKQALDWIKRAALTCLGVLAWLILWRVVNRGHFHQDSFLQYLFAAGRFAPTLANWLHERWTIVVEALVPLDLFLFHRTDPDLVSVDGIPQAWVQFVQQYWCSLAFGSGCLFYFSLLRLTAAGFRKAKAFLLLVFVLSFTLFILYFGPPTAGVLRDEMQAWFLGFVVFGVVMWRRYLAESKTFWRFTTFALAFRGLEVLLVLVPFESWSRGFALQPPFVLSDFCALAVMFLGSAFLALYAVCYCREMQRKKPAGLPQAS